MEEGEIVPEIVDYSSSRHNPAHGNRRQYDDSQSKNMGENAKRRDARDHTVNDTVRRRDSDANRVSTNTKPLSKRQAKKASLSQQYNSTHRPSTAPSRPQPLSMPLDDDEMNAIVQNRLGMDQRQLFQSFMMYLKEMPVVTPEPPPPAVSSTPPTVIPVTMVEQQEPAVQNTVDNALGRILAMLQGQLETINMRNELRKRNSATVKTKLDAKVDEYNAIVAKKKDNAVKMSKLNADIREVIEKVSRLSAEHMTLAATINELRTEISALKEASRMHDDEVFDHKDDDVVVIV